MLAAALASGAWGQTEADRAGLSAEITPEAGHLIVEARGVRPPAPCFFSAQTTQTVQVGASEVVTDAMLTVRVLQGKPDRISLGLSGDGEVVAVTGDGLRDWAVRQVDGRRFLDLRLDAADGRAAERKLTVRQRVVKPAVPGRVGVPLLAPGEAVGFFSQVTVVPGPDLEVRIVRADGLVPVGDPAALQFAGTGAAVLEAALLPRGGALADAELTGAALTGVLDPAAGCVRFQLKAAARVREAGARLEVLSGAAALSEAAAGDGWHAEVSADRTVLVFERAGVFPLDLAFRAAVTANDWQTVNFRMPAGAVVPVTLDGLPGGVVFQPSGSVVPDAASRRGFVPADGAIALGWRVAAESRGRALSFTSQELSDVRVGAGLLRQTSQIDLRILQGKLNGLRLQIDGAGEILGVEGANILNWQVVPDGNRRVLAVQWSRPLEKSGTLVVRSQTPLGNFPVTVEPLRLTPAGGVRHSGFLRMANEGAVRLEVTAAGGLMQLAPAQFPGQPVEARQVFVYRFPSATYAARITATQILPEVAVSQVTIYQLAESDRVITADLELDIREAPVRDWALQVPDGFALAAVQGEAVADYAMESAVQDGRRTVKVVFRGPVDGRQLLRIRLEKNQPAAAGDWELAPLRFPDARSVRGHIGVVSTPGFRILPGTVRHLTEMPLAYFPAQVPGLQQAFRQKDAGWSATVRVEALGQSVQADVFHLYSLKEGLVSGSILLNYFVVGAPASEWRIAVPASAGNVDVVGQNVRRDWRREGDELIVPLNQPVLGPVTLLVTFEQPMSARGGLLQPGAVRPLGVQGERGYVQVVSPRQVKSRVTTAEGSLLKLEPLELPAEYQLLTSLPSLAIYQYTARPFTLEMDIEWYAAAETVDQVVDFSTLASRVSRDGQIVTDVRYFVKTRGRKALRLELPETMTLWETRANGQIINAQVDGRQTLIPLPPTLNPNEPVEVLLRLGQTAARPGHLVLQAPKVFSPTVMNEWKVTADRGQLLVPGRSSVQLTAPVLTETGFEWISRRAPAATLLVVLGTLVCVAMGRSTGSWSRVAAFVLALVLGCAALGLGFASLQDRRANRATLTYSGAAVPAGEVVEIRAANLPAARAMVSLWGVAGGAAGVLLLVWAARRRGRGAARPAAAVGAVALAVGALAQRGGAAGFFLLLAATVLAVLVVPPAIRWLRGQRWTPRVAPAATAIVFGLLPSVLAGPPRAAEAVDQTWKIRDGRLFAECTVTVRGAAGDSFLLVRPPATLTEFSAGEGVRVTKSERDGEVVYFAALDRAGTFDIRAKYELPADDFRQGLALATGPAAVQRVTVEWDQPGWEFSSPAAVSVEPLPGLPETASGARLVLRPAERPIITVQPRKRDVAAEKTRFFAEAANLFLPSPGVVNAISRVTIRPVQGQVSLVEVQMPPGFTVGDVRHGPVAAWQFDPASRVLRVEVTPAQSGNFRFDVESQMGTADLPVDLTLEPVRVPGAEAELGLIGLAFGSEAQPEQVRGLSAVNLEDFDATLLPADRDGQPYAVLQRAFRYGREPARVTLRVAPVAPEVRLVGKQVLSLGDDRLVLAADWRVAITRAGIFRLSFVLPAGWDVEALSGSALAQWSEADDAGQRVVTLQLNGRTIGEHQFSLSLIGPAPGPQESWTVPRVTLREAARQTGELFLVPEKGLRLRAVQRDGLSQIDSRAAGEARPGALAFRLLQADWQLAVGIEALAPWVTVQALQEVTLREGQILRRLGLRCRVENAAIKTLRFRLPGLTADEAATVRGTGPVVSDLVKLPGEDDLWELRFQRGIAGETEAVIEYQGPGHGAQSGETLTPPVFVEARQVTQFVSVRGSGRIEIAADTAPRGWQRVDWNSVPATLHNRSDRSVPAFCYRVAEPEGPLTLRVQRHNLADALRLRVKQADLTTLFSSQGPSLTAVQLALEVVEKSSLRVQLPPGASLLSAFVNDESVSVVREGGAVLLSVAPAADSDRTARVRFVYAAPGDTPRSIHLTGPKMNVPLVNVSWRVLLPPGLTVAHSGGNLRLREERAAGVFGLTEYTKLLSARRASESREAADLLSQAGSYLQQGDQQKAGEVLSKAANNLVLDEASNEDARVQLKSLKTQQAVVGLNTRRQRLYLDNRNTDSTRNEQLEQAASANPFMQGRTDFDLQQMDQLLQGNTAEENSALRGIASRIVEGQLAAEPAPSAIDLTLPDSGRSVTFARSVQVDGETPLELHLTLAPTHGGRGGISLLLLATVALLAGSLIPRPRREVDAR